MLRHYIFPVLVICFNPLFACRLWAALALTGFTLHHDSLEVRQQLDTLRAQTTSYFNNDGWGLLGYSTQQLEPSFHWQSAEPAYSDTLFALAEDTLLTAEYQITLAHGHVRNASSGAGAIPNPHPFVFHHENRTLTFGHNGVIDKAGLVCLLTDGGTDSSWLNAHPPSSYGHGDWDSEGWLHVVDSELYFLWLIRNIESTGDIEAGIHQGLYLLAGADIPYNELLGMHKNFTLADGENLYAYRATVGGSQGALDLYAAIAAEGTHHAVMSNPRNIDGEGSQPWEPIELNYLLKLTPDPSSISWTLIPQEGDVSQDNMIDVLDLVWLVDIILLGDPPTQIQLATGDMDENEALDISDVLQLLAIILET